MSCAGSLSLFLFLFFFFFWGRISFLIFSSLEFDELIVRQDTAFVKNSGNTTIITTTVQA
jgi:hypothetical protein